MSKVDFQFTLVRNDKGEYEAVNPSTNGGYMPVDLFTAVLGAVCDSVKKYNQKHIGQDNPWFFPDERLPLIGMICDIELEAEGEDLEIVRTTATYSAFGWSYPLEDCYSNSTVIKWRPRTNNQNEKA